MYTVEDIEHLKRKIIRTEKRLGLQQLKLKHMVGSHPGEKPSNNYLEQFEKVRKVSLHLKNEKAELLKMETAFKMKDGAAADKPDRVSVPDKNSHPLKEKKTQKPAVFKPSKRPKKTELSADSRILHSKSKTEAPSVSEAPQAHAVSKESVASSVSEAPQAHAVSKESVASSVSEAPQAHAGSIRTHVPSVSNKQDAPAVPESVQDKKTDSIGKTQPKSSKGKNLFRFGSDDESWLRRKK